MKHDEILQAAKDSYLNQLHLKRDGEKHYILDICYPEIERFASIIEKRTIERCAEVCDGFANSHNDQQMIAAMNCAAAIRKLGEQE